MAEAVRIASKCGSAMRVDTLAPESSADSLHWVREHVEAVCSGGARGALYIFIRHPPDPALAGILRWVAADRRLEPTVVAEGAALSARTHLEVLRQAGARALYVTLHGATAAAHDAHTGEAGSWRRALGVLSAAPQLLDHARVGAHVMLSPQSAPDLRGLLKLIRHMGIAELLLWDAGCNGMDQIGLAPAAALRALDFSVRAAQKLGLRLLPVGFERTRSAGVETHAQACVATGAIVELLREGIRLPSARAGLLATDGESAAIAEVAASGQAVGQLAFELAASGSPFLDLPACLGGPPPESSRPPPGGVKLDACRQCPIDSRCPGVPPPMIQIAGLGSEIQPLRHWTAMSEHVRVLVLCPIVTDALYGATFFSLARSLARLGAHVDVVSPWAIHADISASFPERQPTDRPAGASEVERFVADGPVDRYDLIVTPDLHTARALVVDRRLRSGTRLAATDIHMLWGMDEWVRDLCPIGRRPEEGGWWPSDQVVLYSAFPGYARLYTRYGVPLRQIVWQPYALDPASFPSEQPAADGASIISAGYHLRDLDTLLAAAARLGGDVHPLDLYAEGQLPDVPGHIRFRGTVSSSVFCPAVGRSRFMVVSLIEDSHKAAGITAMATAIMCGRPIVATATAAARDYVLDGVSGLLVPPGDATALADAITRLDTDPALLAMLAAGARDVAAKLTTETWARALLHGTRTYEAEHWMWTKWGLRNVRTPSES